MEGPNRQNEQACLSAYLANGECCAVVGLSNTGKSALLRNLSASERSATDKILLFYVDCNRMLDLSEQGFYEAVLRAIRSKLREWEVPADLPARLEQDYQQVVEPRSSLAVPLGFNNAMERLCEADQHVVLILDEFDEPFKALEGRTFLNLRALRDRYREGLTYVTATVRTLEEVRDDPETIEFRELFSGRTCYVAMLSETAARAAIDKIAEEEHIELSDKEVDFITRTTGGHPGLLPGVSRLLVHARTAAPQTYDKMGTLLVAEALTGDEVVRRECRKLWRQLTHSEQQSLLALVQGRKLGKAAREQLERLGVVDADANIFGEAFVSFVEQQRSGRKRQVVQEQGIWVDRDAGEVYVDGRQTPLLTDLEYRLLGVLYERRDKLCDKYRLVEQVWGESYIDEVDDARIEKLVSRVRAKIEHDPTNPRYLVTVRGRGYRLQSHSELPEPQ